MCVYVVWRTYLLHGCLGRERVFVRQEVLTWLVPGYLWELRYKLTRDLRACEEPCVDH